MVFSGFFEGNLLIDPKSVHVEQRRRPPRYSLPRLLLRVYHPLPLWDDSIVHRRLGTYLPLGWFYSVFLLVLVVAFDGFVVLDPL